MISRQSIRTCLSPGRSNKLILENIRYIDLQNKAIENRIPYVPGFNDNRIEKIAEFASALKKVKAVKILPYHNYAGSKYQELSVDNTLPETFPTDEQIRAAEKIIQNAHGNDS